MQQARSPGWTALLLSASIVLATTAFAQPADPPAAAQPAPSASARAVDCSRWPASTFDESAGSCVCPSGLWWNLRGDACLPKEHAAGEFCSTVWPSSQPLFTNAGGYRCVCIPPLMWDSQAVACRAPFVEGEQDCLREWPGTLPVLSPSGTEFECRCPGGRRWDDARRACVDGAPVVPVARGFFVPDGAAPPAGGLPPSGAMPPSGGAPPIGSEPVPGGEPPAARPYGAPPASIPPRPYGDDLAPPPDARDAAPPAAGSVPGETGTAPPSPQAFPAPPKSSGANCEALLGEIRARAAAGQAQQADSLGMKAAISGCNPKDIADAAKVGQQKGAH